MAMVHGEPRKGTGLFLLAVVFTFVAVCSDLIWEAANAVLAGNSASVPALASAYFRNFVDIHGSFAANEFYLPIIAIMAGVLLGLVGRRARFFLYVAVIALAAVIYWWLYNGALTTFWQKLYMGQFNSALWLSCLTISARLLAVLCLLAGLSRAFRWNEYRRGSTGRFRLPFRVIALLLWGLCLLSFAYAIVLDVRLGLNSALFAQSTAGMALLGATICLFRASLPWSALPLATAPFLIHQNISYVWERLWQADKFSWNALLILMMPLLAVCSLVLLCGYTTRPRAARSRVRSASSTDDDIISYIIKPYRGK